MRLGAALALVACGGDCNSPFSESARNGDKQVLAEVTYDTAFNRAPPAVVYRDSLRTVRILADTVRLFPGQFYYLRKTVYGVRTGTGPEVRQPASPQWVSRTLYEVDDFVDRYAVLDSFEIAPGVPPGSARWDNQGRTEAAVYVQREVRADSMSLGTRAWTGIFVPARRR